MHQRPQGHIPADTRKTVQISHSHNEVLPPCRFGSKSLSKSKSKSIASNSYFRSAAAILPFVINDIQRYQFAGRKPVIPRSWVDRIEIGGFPDPTLEQRQISSYSCPSVILFYLDFDPDFDFDFDFD
jgi:hypothetical protein